MTIKTTKTLSIDTIANGWTVRVYFPREQKDVGQSSVYVFSDKVKLIEFVEEALAAPEDA